MCQPASANPGGASHKSRGGRSVSATYRLLDVALIERPPPLVPQEARRAFEGPTGIKEPSQGARSLKGQTSGLIARGNKRACLGTSVRSRESARLPAVRTVIPSGARLHRAAASGGDAVIALRQRPRHRGGPDRTRSPADGLLDRAAAKGPDMPKITNPILPGFNPDPSILRVGDTYYIATSTFEWFPGVQIHASKDLGELGPCRAPARSQGAARHARRARQLRRLGAMPQP